MTTPTTQASATEAEIWRARLWELIEAYRNGHAWPNLCRDAIKHHLTKLPALASQGAALGAQGPQKAEARVEELEAELDAKQAELDEALHQPWPEWAKQVLKMTRKLSGYDGYDDQDGIDVAEEVREAYAELTSQIERLRATPAVDLHPATVSLVDRFAAALKGKLAAAEKKYGYSDGWASPDWIDECRAHLMEQIAKGDPRDVAAYCAFLWHHGASTAAPQKAEATQAAAGDEERTTEKHIALREGHRIKGGDDYFAARAQVLEDDAFNRSLFDAGFDRGFDAAEKVYPPQAAQAQPQAVPATGKESLTVAHAELRELQRPAMSKPAIFLDSFSGTAAELPKGRRTDADVLEALRTDPRVSTFDMGELPWLRSIIKSLKADGSIVEIDEPYPWLRFKVSGSPGGGGEGLEP